MKLKFIFETVRITSHAINPTYLPDYGTIIDSNSGKVMYVLPHKEITKFFYFRIEFSNYKYDDIYQPKTGGFKKELVARLYNLVMYVNLNTIIRDKGATESLYNRLAYYLSAVQMLNMSKRKIYNLEHDKLKTIIDFREKHNIFLLPWYYFKLDNSYCFDLMKMKIINAKNVKKVNFNRRGGIIETNNVRSTIQEFSDNRKNIIIIPDSMTNLWKNHEIITYRSLMSYKNPDFKKLDKGIDRIIVHECHVNFLPQVKKLVQKINCDTIWIINSLPLKYYCNITDASNKNLKNIPVNDLASFINLWADFNIGEKKQYKSEILVMLINKLEQFYFQPEYKQNYNKNIKTQVLNLVTFEKNIYQHYHNFYTNWKMKLTNDEENKYSFTNKNKIDSLETGILNSILTLIFSITNQNDIPAYFKNQIKKTIHDTKNIKNSLDILINGYDKIEAHIKKIASTENIGNIYNIDQILPQFKDKNMRASTVLNNYRRYYKSKTNTIELNCPICYGDHDLVYAQTICGHTICLECILNTLTRANECPICKEFITSQKLAIIAETVHDYKSDILEYIRNIKSDTVILTDLSAISELAHNKNFKPRIINTINCDYGKIILSKRQIKKICIIGSDKFLKNHKNILEFFQIQNAAPIIEIVKINLLT